MARKKIVFIIVEGPSDDEALGVIFSRIYKQQEVHVHIMHKDITAEYGSSSDNIISAVGNEIKAYANSNHFKNSDFQEIIHIVDTDGAFVSPDCIVEDETAEKPVYSPIKIRTKNKRALEKRNEQKSLNLCKLYARNDIWKIPYKVYYMSCNLDHVLYDKQNSTDEEKERNSFLFAKHYRDSIPAFLNLLCNSDFSVSLSYKNSWNYIKEGYHSLERHTNLGLCFNDPNNNM